MRAVSVTALAVAATLATTTTGAAINIGDYQGIALIHLNAGACNAGTNTTRLQHSEDGSTGWNEVPNGSFAAVGVTASEQTLKLNTDALRKFVRVVDTLVTATSAPRSVTLVGRKQYS